MNRPTKAYAEVKAMLGSASDAWEKLVGHIRFYYEIDEKWAEGKPTHKHYNNLYFKRGGKPLITLCLREGFFLVGIVLGKNERDKFDEQRESFSEEIRKQYDESEILHDGLWLGFEVRDESINDDLIRLMQIKRKPNRKILPESIEKCGQLDIGMSHEDITTHIAQSRLL
ncbi:MAG: DUF3788 domain-containing protein [Defluviitaleaceae bacterium]|nr:DUF3788 domain-containing protein [Defluviitaleaceae bacterium]